ncbi:hypothetical protein [uncultured Tateyamaria sp.]|uniref:hypothetical protein n=1 Tax=uncultured Tateyamaria sp. TaxID=455651 RepID=UPI00344D3055
MTGELDAVLIGVFRDMEEYQSLCDRLPSAQILGQTWPRNRFESLNSSSRACAEYWIICLPVFAVFGS